LEQKALQKKLLGHPRQKGDGDIQQQISFGFLLSLKESIYGQVIMKNYNNN